MNIVYRLKSDNYNCWVSLEAYKEIILQMSTGDYCTHKAKAFKVNSNTLENIKWHQSKGYIDITYCFEPELGDEHYTKCYSFYDGFGDCTFEPVDLGA